MAIFKDKTGRGEVDYAKSPVQGSDGTILFLNDHTGNTPNVFAFQRGIQTNHLVFQLRGESAGVKDVSDNEFSITESSALTKRMESVNHTTRLKTFQFSDGKTLSFTPKLLEKYQSENVASSPVPRLGRAQIDPDSPIETIIPAVNDANTLGGGGAAEVIISFWVNISEFGTGTDGGGSCIMEQVSGTARTFGIVVSSTGQLVFRWYDWGVNSTNALDFQQIKTRAKLALNTWYHVTFFVKGGAASSPDDNYAYNTSGLDSKHQDHDVSHGQQNPQVAIFINGQEQLNPSEAGKTSGNFIGTLGSDPLFPVVLGTGLGGYDNSAPQFQSNAHFKGRLAEVSYFYTHRLARASVFSQTIIESRPPYRSIVARALMTGKKQPTSGLTNITSRLILRELDQNSTHPTVKRSGDQRRLGNHSIKFDDSRAQTLKGATVQYPTKLVQGDNLIDTIYGGYFNGDLTLSHTASVEAYDTFYRRNDQPAHKPFVESRIYLDSGSNFYQTGTLETVLPGFNQPLSRKASFTIDLTPTEGTEFGFTGSLNHAYAGVGNTVDNAGDGTFVNLNNSAAPSGADVDVPIGSLMMYWNDSTKRFEKKGRIRSVKFDYLKNRNTGDGSVGNSITPDALASEYTNNLCTGFSRTSTLETTLLSSSNGGGAIDDGAVYEAVNGDKTIFALTARPISTWGFPFASKYEHIDNGHIKMSDYITEPFLLEKIVYEFSASFEAGTNSNTTTSGRYSLGIGVGGVNPSSGPGTNSVVTAVQHHHYTFFMLREFFNPQPRVDKTLVTFQEDASSNSYIQPTAVAGFGTTFSQQFTGSDKSREMIGYGQVFVSYRIGNTDSYDSTTYEYVKNSGFGREVNIEVDTAVVGSDGTGTTGSYRMEFIPSVTPKYDVSSPVRLGFPHDSADGLDNNLIFDYYVGGRGNDFDLETRNIAGSIVGKDPGNAGFIYGSSANSNPMFATRVDDVTPQDSPYILMPEDKLIFGWNAPTELNDGFSGLNAKRAVMSVLPNKGQVTFFGSFLKSGQPKQINLNQLLNNDIVHEAIGTESIHDQFDVETRGSFTGSFVDEVLSGSSTGPLYNTFDGSIHIDGIGTDDFANLARRVIGRSSEGTQGTTGSLRRSVPFISEDKTELDSFLFDTESIFKKDETSGLNSRFERSYINDFAASTFGTGPLADFMLFGNDPSQKDGGPSEPDLRPNTILKTSYLFSRYHDITRVRQDQIFAANKLAVVALSGSNLTLNGTLLGYLDQNPELDPIDLDDTPTPDAGRHIAFLGSRTGPNVDGGLFFTGGDVISYLNSPKETAKFLFGLGNGVLSSHYYTAPVLGSDNSVITIDDIRGFKYGISNLGDKKPKNIFRRGRYGQLRDMLEMAPNTAYVDDASNSIEFAVEAQFFADDGSIAAPDATSCSNLSTNVTSSAPFFDRDQVEFEDPLVIRNRGPLNNRVVDITIEI